RDSRLGQLAQLDDAARRVLSRVALGRARTTQIPRPSGRTGRNAQRDSVVQGTPEATASVPPHQGWQHDLALQNTKRCGGNPVRLQTRVGHSRVPFIPKSRAWPRMAESMDESRPVVLVSEAGE